MAGSEVIRTWILPMISLTVFCVSAMALSDSSEGERLGQTYVSCASQFKLA